MAIFVAVHFKFYRQTISYNVFDVYKVSRKAGLGRSAEGLELDTLSQAMPQIKSPYHSDEKYTPVGSAHVRTIRLRPCFFCWIVHPHPIRVSHPHTFIRSVLKPLYILVLCRSGHRLGWLSPPSNSTSVCRIGVMFFQPTRRN